MIGKILLKMNYVSGALAKRARRQKDWIEDTDLAKHSCGAEESQAVRL